MIIAIWNTDNHASGACACGLSAGVARGRSGHRHFRLLDKPFGGAVGALPSLIWIKIGSSRPS
jgi:hypothetical protein